MDLLNTLYNLMGLVFVLGMIISMGLSLTMKQIALPPRIDWPEGAAPADTWTRRSCVWTDAHRRKQEQIPRIRPLQSRRSAKREIEREEER